MSAVGGRTRWVRVVSFTSGSALLLGAAGCGGRTSTLDQDAYLGNGTMPIAGVGSGGASGQGGLPSKGGAPSAAGSAPMSTAGQSNAPADSVAAACRSYCEGYAVECPLQLMGKNCEQTCQQEMTSFGERCKGLGLKALKCLTPFFGKDASSCDAASRSALNQCGAQVQRFQDCKRATQPEPDLPPSKPIPGSCPSVAELGANACSTTYSCLEGTYTVTCDYSGPPDAGSPLPYYGCLCFGPNGGQNTTLTAPVPPCANAAQLCGFTIGAK